jgi:hypothetical protein
VVRSQYTWPWGQSRRAPEKDVATDTSAGWAGYAAAYPIVLDGSTGVGLTGLARLRISPNCLSSTVSHPSGIGYNRSRWPPPRKQSQPPMSGSGTGRLVRSGGRTSKTSQRRPSSAVKERWPMESRGGSGCGDGQQVGSAANQRFCRTPRATRGVRRRLRPPTTNPGGNGRVQTPCRFLEGSFDVWVEPSFRRSRGLGSRLPTPIPTEETRQCDSW